MLQETFHRKSLSIIGGLARWRFYCLIHAGGSKGRPGVEFLRHLPRQLPGQLLILWEGAGIHRPTRGRDYVASTRGRVAVERRPACAPELNPAEYLWGHRKTPELAHLLARPAGELSFAATAALRRMRRSPSIITAGYAQAEWWPQCHRIRRDSITHSVVSAVARLAASFGKLIWLLSMCLTVTCMAQGLPKVYDQISTNPRTGGIPGVLDTGLVTNATVGQTFVPQAGALDFIELKFRANQGWKALPGDQQTIWVDLKADLTGQIISSTPPSR